MSSVKLLKVGSKVLEKPLSRRPWEWFFMGGFPLYLRY
jgi:hypothetical protein